MDFLVELDEDSDDPLQEVQYFLIPNEISTAGKSKIWEELFEPRVFLDVSSR